MKFAAIAILVAATTVPVAAENNPVKFAMYAKDPRFVLALQDKYESQINYVSPQSKVTFFDSIIHCGSRGYKGRDVPLYNLLLVQASAISQLFDEKARVEYTIDVRDGSTLVKARTVFDDLPSVLSRLRTNGASPTLLEKISAGRIPRLVYIVSSSGLVKAVGSPGDAPDSLQLACEGEFGPIYSEL